MFKYNIIYNANHYLSTRFNGRDRRDSRYDEAKPCPLNSIQHNSQHNSSQHKHNSTDSTVGATRRSRVRSKPTAPVHSVQPNRVICIIHSASLALALTLSVHLPRSLFTSTRFPLSCKDRFVV